ncbi:MAG: hypothetical protein ACOYBO_07710 [Azonexus sp.]
MADERLNILINARNNARGELDSLKGQLGGLNSAAGVLTGGMAGLAAGMGIGLVLKAGQAAVELGKLGAASLEMKDSFEQTARSIGANGAEILAAMRTASGGMVQDTELVADANRALLMGAADSAEEFSKLMEVARVRSDAVGISVGEAWSALAEGIGRAQEKQLYVLGINLDLVKVNEDYAASLGKTAGQLTEAERKQSLFNAVIKDSAAVVAAAAASGLSDADKIDQAAVSWENLKTTLGEVFSGPVASAMQTVADILDGINSAGKQSGGWDASQLEGFATKLKELNDLEAQGVTLDAAQAQSKRVFTAALQAHSMALGTASERKAQNKADSLALAAAETATAGSIDAATAAIAKQMNQVDLAGDVVDGYISHLQSMASGMAAIIGTGATLSKLKAEEDQVRRLQETYEKLGWSQMQIAVVMAQDTAIVEDQWQGIIDAPGQAAAEAEKAARSATTAYTHMTDMVSQSFDALKSKVSGVLQGALDPGVGVNPDDLLPRKDGINENARRVAAIATEGFKDQSWLEEFRSEAPDIAKALQEAADPKAAAAQLLKDFQDGLVPELIDKDAAKEKVKRMITGEATMAQLATEIASELSTEMGISLAQAQAATNQTLGTGAPGQTGGVAPSLNGKGTGTLFVDEMTAAIVQKNGDIQKSGETAGVTWRMGFLSRTTVDIPTALVVALATLVTPEVQKAIDAQKGRTGAY